MAIPERQCSTWSNPGATVTAVATHEAVRRALAADGSPLRNHNYEVFLQGSYKNDTNVRGDSDVDVVVLLTESFHENLDSLDQPGKQRWNLAYPNRATYTVSDFDRDVQTALRNAYGNAAVQPQDKCILVTGGNGRLNADVVVSVEMKDYVRFNRIGDEQIVDGIAIWPRNTGGGWIENYPKRHYANGVAKNQRTNELYKPSVRMFKNARNCLIDRRLLSDQVAPSYFVECFLYNAPDDCFDGPANEIFHKVRTWMPITDAALDPMVCQNGRIMLFGPSAQQWSKRAAVTYVNALVDLWNDWS
jgi:hypothetical protein